MSSEPRVRPQLTLWTTLGVLLGELLHRLQRPPLLTSPSLTTRSSLSDVINPPSAGVYAEARRRLDALAKPLGALGRLEDLAAWVAACQGTCPPRPLDRVRAVILAGDHGVSTNGVSAYPREVTAVMVRAFVAGVAGANVLARQHGVALRVLELGVDDDLEDVPAEVSAYHIGSSRPIDEVDARQRTTVGRRCAPARRSPR